MNNFQKAQQDDLIVLRQLWYEAFLEHDGKESIDYYFENNFNLDNTFILKIDNEIVSSLQLNQHQIMYNNKVIDVSFIIGVATFKIYRGKGYMKQLLNNAIDYAEDVLKQDYMILQAYNWDLYRPFNFIDAYYKSVNKITLNELETYEQSLIEEVNERRLLDIYNEYTKNFNGYALRDLNYFKKLFPLFKVEKVKILTSKQAYLFYQVSSEEIIVNECAFKNKKVLYSLLKSCLLKENKNTITFYSDIENFNSEKQLFMMVKNLQEAQFIINDKLYISETI